MKSLGSGHRGFSLVEMLVVISVIGIITAIAIPSISNVNESAQISKDQRNAQQMASVFAAASGAGVDLYGGDLRETISNVIAGGTATDGVFEDAYFGLPNMSFADRKAASNYLDLNGESLVYVPAGTGVTIINPNASTLDEWQEIVSANPEIVAAARGINLTENWMSIEEALAIPGNVLRNARRWFTLKEYNGWSSSAGKLEVLSDNWSSAALDGHKLEMNHDTRDNMYKDFEATSDDQLQVISLDFSYADRIASNRLNLSVIGDMGTVHNITYDNHLLYDGWSDVVENVILQAGENFRVEFSSDSSVASIGTLLKDDLEVRAVAVSDIALSDINPTTSN